MIIELGFTLRGVCQLSGMADHRLVAIVHMDGWPVRAGRCQVQGFLIYKSISDNFPTTTEIVSLGLGLDECVF